MIAAGNMITESRRAVLWSTLLALMLLLLPSCGPSDTTQRGDGGGADTLPPDPYSDGPLELPDYEGDPFAGFGPVTRIDVPGGIPGAPADTSGADPTAGPQDQVSLFSVQIAACDTRDGADRLAALARQALPGESVRVDSVPPYWKVRVDGFSSRSEAEAFLPTLRALGYTDAWVVERSGGPD